MFLGKNFSKKNLAKIIFRKINFPINCKVIEFSSGYGNLTKFIIMKRSKLLSIEIDNRICLNFRKNFTNKVNIKKCNIIKFNLKLYGKVIIIGNIPYYITKKMFKLFKKFNIKKMFLTLSKNHLNKIKGFNIFKLFNIKNNMFYPIPKIKSVFVEVI
ncbi:rRNA adenine N-6-methyltransferase family protein [Candidatus Vidania fulgoroideorum]